MKAVQTMGILSLAAFALALVPSIATAQTAPAVAPAPVSTDSLESVHQQLITLQKMLDERLISPPEYETARAKLLASIGVTPPPPASPAPAPVPLQPAPPPPPPAATPVPPPPTPAALLASFAGHWNLVRTRIDTLPSQTVEYPEPLITWVVTAPNSALAISREEEIVRFGHRSELVVTPQEVVAPTIAGTNLTFSITQSTPHDHPSTSTTTFVLQLTPTPAPKLEGTYTRDTETTELHGIVKTHETGKVELTRIP